MKRGNDGRLELPSHAVGQRLHELNLNEQHVIEVEAQTAIDDIERAKALDVERPEWRGAFA